jgi:hypothetical protein
MGSIGQLTEEILSLPSVSNALLADKLVENLEFDEARFRMALCSQFRGKKLWLKLDD